MKKLINTINYFLWIRPKTFLIAVFLIYLYFFPIQQKDIVANLYVLAFLILLSVLSIAILINKIFLIENLNFKIEHSKNLKDFSNTPITYSLKITECKILPLFRLKTFFEFENTDFKSSNFIVKGFSKKEVSINSELIFPHRGIWNVKSFNYELEDSFGFFRRKGKVVPKESISFDIYPRVSSAKKFPIISSIQKEGEAFQASEHRKGDPLDLKAYHPSDGLKKIAWKIYARSGELISRHQEPSMNPEGTLAVCVLASKQDAAASLSLGYLKKAIDSEMYVLVNSLGAPNEFSFNVKDTEDNLLKNVWNSEFNFKNIELAIDSHITRNKERKYDNLVLILNDSDCISEENVKNIKNIVSKLKDNQIKPIMFLAYTETVNKESIKEALNTDCQVISEVNYYE